MSLKNDKINSSYCTDKQGLHPSKNLQYHKQNITSVLRGPKGGLKTTKITWLIHFLINFTGKKLHCKLKFLKLLFESLSLTHARSILQIQLKFLSISLNEQFLSEMHLQFYFHLLFMKMHKRLYSQYPISVTELLCFRFEHSLNCCWCCHSGKDYWHHCISALIIWDLIHSKLIKNKLTKITSWLGSSIYC